MIDLIPHTTYECPVALNATVVYTTMSNPNHIHLPVKANEVVWSAAPTFGRIKSYAVVNENIEGFPVERVVFTETKKERFSEQAIKMILSMRECAATWDEIGKAVGASRTSTRDCYYRNKKLA